MIPGRSRSRSRSRSHSPAAPIIIPGGLQTQLPLQPLPTQYPPQGTQYVPVPGFPSQAPTQLPYHPPTTAPIIVQGSGSRSRSGSRRRLSRSPRRPIIVQRADRGQGADREGVILEAHAAGADTPGAHEGGQEVGQGLDQDREVDPDIDQEDDEADTEVYQVTIVVVGAAVAAIAAAAAVRIVVAEVVPEIRAVVTLRAAVILQGAVLPVAVIRLDHRNMQAIPLNLIIHPPSHPFP